jgi:hypothetical protein
MQQRGNILSQYKESGGTALPPGAQLEERMFEDQAGNPQDVPVYSTYGYKDLTGKSQQIQLPNPVYQNELALQQAEERARLEEKARQSIQEPYDIKKFNREKTFKIEEDAIQQGYDLEKIKAQGEAQRKTRNAAKKDLSALAEGAAIHPELLDNMTPGDRDIVQNEILKRNLQWTPPVVQRSRDRYTQAKEAIARIKQIPGYIGTAGNLARNLGGQTTALDLEVQGLKALLTEGNLNLMRGLGHMSDNDLKVIQGALTTLDVKNPRFKQALKVIEDTVNSASKKLDERAKNAPPPLSAEEEEDSDELAKPAINSNRKRSLGEIFGH